MSIPDLLNAPWAITPEMYVKMCEIYLAHLRGETADLPAIEAALGRPLDNKRDGYSVQSGVAVIPVDGVISKRMGLFSRISGGTSTQALQQDLSDAAADPMAHSILLLVDSPGGEVDGTQAAASMVRAIRDEGKKPIVALADGLMASAAYWIGSAADKVYSTGDTAAVGSIGIIAKHMDYSKAQEQRGVKITEITAGKYKSTASENGPLTDDGRADIQAKVDHLYSVFVDDVAANRRTDSKTVLDKMADGRVFLGKQAIDAGLIDGFASVPELVSQLNKKRPQVPVSAPAAAKPVAASNAITETASAEISSASRIPTDADYMRRFNQYKAEKGMSQFDAMQRALREHTLEVQLAEVAQMHELRASREQNNQTMEEPEVNANQSTAATLTEEQVIEQARALSAIAQAHRAEVHRRGDRITWLEAIAWAKKQQASNGKPAIASNDPLERAKALAEEATEYRARAMASGRTLTIAQAVAEVSKLNPSNVAAPAVAAKPVSAADSLASDEEKIERAKALSTKAQAYLAEQRKAGNISVTIADAVMHVSKQ